MDALYQLSYVGLVLRILAAVALLERGPILHWSPSAASYANLSAVIQPLVALPLPCSGWRRLVIVYPDSCERVDRLGGVEQILARVACLVRDDLRSFRVCHGSGLLRRCKESVNQFSRRDLQQVAVDDHLRSGMSEQSSIVRLIRRYPSMSGSTPLLGLLWFPRRDGRHELRLRSPCDQHQ